VFIFQPPFHTIYTARRNPAIPHNSAKTVKHPRKTAILLVFLFAGFLACLFLATIEYTTSIAEGQALDGGRAEAAEGGFVGRGGIAFVLGVTIAGVFGVQGNHDAVPLYFGQDGGGHDAGVDGVAVNDRDNSSCLEFACANIASVLNAGGDVGAVYENFGLKQSSSSLEFACANIDEAIVGAGHGEEGGLEYVDAVDFFRGGAADSPKGAGFYEGFEALALAGGELFGIVELLHREVIGEDYRRRYYGAGKATSAGFVQTYVHSMALKASRRSGSAL
jgi:hypothetical protein